MVKKGAANSLKGSLYYYWATALSSSHADSFPFSTNLFTPTAFQGNKMLQPTCKIRKGYLSVFLSGLAVVLLCFVPTPNCLGQDYLEFNEFVDGTTSSALTSIEIGPDGRLYAAGFRGEIYRWDLEPTTGEATNQTMVFTTNGNSNTLRQTGIAFDPNSTASNLILWNSYATDEGPGFLGRIDRIDLNAGTSQNFINGLGVAAHQNNDLIFGTDGRLYLSAGSLTAAGGIPVAGINELAETPLSAAIVVADVNSASFPSDLNVAPSSGYDATAPGAPVTTFAEGVRNAFDIVQHSNGFLYSGVNGNDGPNAMTPDDPGTAANEAVGAGRPDETFIRLDPQYYYGHPNSSISNFISYGGNPTSGFDGDFQNTNYPVGTQPDPRFTAGVNDGAIFNLLDAVGGGSISPNGLAEYTGNTGLQGQVLVALFNNSREIGSIELDDAGNVVGFNTLSLPGGGDFLFAAPGQGNPLDVAVDSATGNVYIASFFSQTGAGQVVRLTPTTSVAAGPNTITFTPNDNNNLDVNGNWISETGVVGFPVAGDMAVVNVDSTLLGVSGLNDLAAGGDLIFGGGGILTATVDFVANVPDSVTFNNHTVNADDDIFTGGPNGNFIFNPGSVTNVDDDFEANGQGTITINGGTHSVGLDSPNIGFLGAQRGSTLNFFGGTIDAQGFRTTAGNAGIPEGGFIDVDCDATLTTGEVTLDPSGSINFNSTWTGSLTNTSFSESDWENLLVSSANGTRTLDGNAITSGIAFDGSVVGEFQITNDGQTLSVISVAKPGDVLKGDVNLDGNVTFLDISPFITVLATNVDQAEADCNCDGVVSFLDIAVFISILAGN